MRRLAAGLIAAAFAAGCGGGRLQPDGGPKRDGGADAVEGGGGLPGRYPGFIAFGAGPNRKLDLLFVVDNSSAMEFHQANLVANVPRFMDVLKALPDGLPDLHVAAITSDLGAGSNDIPFCRNGGDQGAFQFGVGTLSNPVCPTTGLDPQDTFIRTTGGQNPQNNFAGDIADVLGCILPVGVTGCGFERPLASLARALGAGGGPIPLANLGFLRPDAYLGIVILASEDDCSAANEGFYDATSNLTLASELGPAGNFRCNEFGHLCDGAPPARRAPNDAIGDTVTYQSCVSAEDAGRLTPVRAFADGIKALKPDPSMIAVTSIQGPTSPYRIGWKQPAVADDGPWPEVVSSCTTSGGSYGMAGVRLQQFAESFGGNGLVYSICQDNFGPALNAVATKLSTLMGPRCIPGPVADKDHEPANGVQPDCTVIDHRSNAEVDVDTPVASCDENGNKPPCWSLRAPAATESCATEDVILQVYRGAVTPPADLLVLVKCAACTAGASNPATGCP